MTELDISDDGEIIEVGHEFSDEEEEPGWVKTAEAVLEDSNQEKQQSADYFLETIEDLKIRLKQAQDWRPRPQHEVEEHRLALMKRQCSLMEDQNKLIGLLVETIEETNGHTRIQAHCVKKIVERYDW